MKISIHYFRNIAETNLAIEDKKINFLVGPCGAGKSSIVDAISEPPKPLDTTVGHNPEETTILVDGQTPSYNRTAKYCLSRQEALFSKNANDEGYRVFIGDASKLQELEASFDDEVAELQEASGRLRSFCSDVDSLGKFFGKPGVKGEYTPKSKLKKAICAIDNASVEVHATLENGGTDFLEWRMKGANFLQSSNGKCPYCEQSLDEKLINKLRELDDADLKCLKPLFDSSGVLSNLDITRPNFADEVDVREFEEKLIETYKIKNEIEKVLMFCGMSSHVSAIDKVPDKIIVDPVIYKRFPQLKAIIEGINEKAGALKALVGSMKGAFNSIVGRNTSALNNKLASLGVPYKFTLDIANRDEHRASYKLVHVDAANLDTDMREALSYGERNLVALLLFLHNDASGLVLIDDPASSYDDFRRSQIYNFIRCQQDKTMLVVSHDHAFVRRAVKDKCANIGSILFVASANGSLTFKAIDKHSFVNIDDEIKRRIASSETYEQKIINARLYYEIHRDNEELVWEYLSAVLHGTSPEEIEQELEVRGADEQAILDGIESTVNVRIEPAHETRGMLHPSTVDGWTDFELLIYEREVLNGPEKKTQQSQTDRMHVEMLNDLVHMNDCMLFALNPYEYPVWSPELQELACGLRESIREKSNAVLENHHSC